MLQPGTDGNHSIDQPTNHSAPHSLLASSLPSHHKPLRVGYALNPKKTRLFDARGLFTQPTAVRAHNRPHPTFTPLDLSRPLHGQGPFDVLLLKLTDAMARALYNSDNEARQQVEQVEAYGRDSGCVMIDDLQLVRRVIDRRRIAELLNTVDITVNGHPVRPPPTISIDLPTAGPVSLPFSYPVVCKPVQSCGSTASHTFYIVYSAEQLCSLVATSGSYVVQQLLSHSGTMYKVYVVNNQSFVVPKPSIPPHVTSPTQPPASPLTLDSQSMTLTPLIHSSPPATHSQQSTMIEADVSVSAAMAAVLHGVAGRLSAVFGLTLYGFDVVESGGVLYVVDVNYFPSYNRVDGLSDKLAAAIEDKYDREMVARQRLAVEQQKKAESDDVNMNGHSVR